MATHLRSLRRSISIVAAATLVVGGLLVAQSAQADSAPVDPTNPATPATVSDDVLPTPQIDGVVYNQIIVGNTVYVGGKWTTARPFGSAAGVNTVAQPYLLSYNLTTGAMNTAFRPALNGQVRAIQAAADGTDIYVSGSFTTVNGTTRNRVAELNGTTGALVTTFNATPNYVVNSLALSGNNLYIGGGFSSVGGQNHAEIALLNATTGAPSASFNASAAGTDALVAALAVSPDGTQLVAGGNFTTLDGSSNPGYGLGAVNATTGALMPFAVNSSLLRDAGTKAGVTAFSTDASGIYISAYDWTGGGNFEGTVHASWSGGSLIWVEDCHGDTYSIANSPTAVYVSGHSHVCSTLGGFPQTSPWTYHHGLAFSKAVTQKLTASADLVSHTGDPAPSLLNWFPYFTEGTYTGLQQATWSVAANSQYVVYGGEFPAVNGVQQEGLARFAIPTIAPNKMGPSTNVVAPTFTGVGNNTVTVNWQTVSDPDNATLTYSIYRDGAVSPIATKQVYSTFWKMPTASWTDTTASAGTTHTYRVAVSDPFGNSQSGTTASVKTTGTAGTTPPPPPVTNPTPTTGYAATVKSQGASDYWRLDQAAGATTSADSLGSLPLTLQAGVTGATAGAVGDSDTASTFSGTSTGQAATTSAVTGPNTFSVAAWFKTTTTAGGKVVGFGDAPTGLSGKFDRHIYMNADGTLTYGVRTVGVDKLLSSTAKYNDGAWHEAIATTGTGGSALYVDGRLIASDTTATSAQTNTGYWKIGGDKTWSTPTYFAGSIDDVSVYPAVLTPTQVAAQWTAAGR